MSKPRSPPRAPPSPRFPAWPAGFGDQTTPAFYGAGVIDLPVQREHRAPARGSISKSRRSAAAARSPARSTGPAWSTSISPQSFCPTIPHRQPWSRCATRLRSARDPQKPDSKETINVDVLGVAVGNLRGATYRARVCRAQRTWSSAEGPGARRCRRRQRSARPGRFRLLRRDRAAAVPLAEVDLRHIVANWGWAIVIQTLIINLALLPLRISR